jgi:hypothetical protein
MRYSPAVALGMEAGEIRSDEHDVRRLAEALQRT